MATDSERIDSQLEQRLERYLEAIERGDVAAAAALEAGLPTDARDGFEATVDELARVTDRLGLLLSAGQVIAHRYELRAKIGQGGFGRVWRARDLSLQRDVAVKFIRLSQTRDYELRRFRTEVRALVRSGCRGIPQVYDVGMHGDDAFLVLELVSGSSLTDVFHALRAAAARHRLSSHDLTAAIAGVRRRSETDLCQRRGERGEADADYFRAVARIGARVLRTLQTVHDARIRHRDIKPGNVILRAGGAPVLVDFGLAALCGDDDSGSQAFSLSGTLPYLAPEQLRQMRTGVDARTDVFQVGLLLYEFLALQPAYRCLPEAPDLRRLRSRAIAPPSSLRPRVPRDLEAICMMALAERPDDRYQTAADFCGDLERWLDGCRPPIALGCEGGCPWRKRLRYFARRRRAWLLLAMGVVSGVVVARLLAAAC